MKDEEITSYLLYDWHLCRSYFSYQLKVKDTKYPIQHLQLVILQITIQNALSLQHILSEVIAPFFLQYGLRLKLETNRNK